MTTEHISISLPELIEEALKHAGSDKREALIVLLHKARANTSPPHLLKQQFAAQVGVAVLRSAVGALMERGRRGPSCIHHQPRLLCCPSPLRLPTPTTRPPRVQHNSWEQ